MYGILLAEGGGTLRRGAETIFGKSDAKLDDIWVQAIANDIWVLEQMVKAGDVMTRLLNNICWWWKKWREDKMTMLDNICRPVVVICSVRRPNNIWSRTTRRHVDQGVLSF